VEAGKIVHNEAFELTQAKVQVELLFKSVLYRKLSYLVTYSAGGLVALGMPDRTLEMIERFERGILI